MLSFDQRLTQALERRREAGLLRALAPVERIGGGRIRCEGREMIDCSSNDYLGLCHHPHMIATAKDWTDRFGAGSGASRLVTGHSWAVEALEARIAVAKGAESALIFASGWQLNASLLPPLTDPALWEGVKPVILADKLIHASLYAGSRLSQATLVRFRHNDLDHLAQLLETHAASPKFVVTESVFSMDGDRADLIALADLCARHDALLYVDEAHATGVLGPTGSGLSLGLNIPIVMGTFSKALGGFGAYVVGSKALTDYLVNGASGLIYATALPPAVLGSMDAALDLFPQMERQRLDLQRRAQCLRDMLTQAGLNTGASTTQIVPVMIGGEAAALLAAARLKELGILAMAIRPPTVPPGASRLRLSLSAAHSDDDILSIAKAVISVCEAP